MELEVEAVEDEDDEELKLLGLDMSSSLNVGESEDSLRSYI